MRKFHLHILCFFLIFSILLVGCQNSANNSPEISDHATRGHQQQYDQQKESLLPIIPLKVDEETFQYIIGWMSEEEILFNELEEGKSTIFSYNVIKGEKIARLEFEGILHSAEISPSGKYLLLHTSHTPYEAQLDIYELDQFELIYETAVESREIEYEWNPAYESQLLVTAFYEDWSFKTYILDAENNTLQEVNLIHPFAKWFNGDFILLNWNQDQPSYHAPLVTFDGSVEQEVLNDEKFYYLDSWLDFFVVVKESQDHTDLSEWNFYDENFQQILNFSIPHLSNFSGWNIPYYDLIKDKNELIIIEPLESGEADIYSSGYQLVIRDIQTGKEEILIDSIENMPIHCSNDGNYCLFGHQFEKIIIVREQDIVDLIEKE